MEFDIFNVAGQKRTIEGESISLPKEWAYIKDGDGNVIWGINPNAVAFVNYKKDEERKPVLVVSK